MGQTPRYALRYPEGQDPPAGHQQMRRLAEDVEAALTPIDTRSGRILGRSRVPTGWPEDKNRHIIAPVTFTNDPTRTIQIRGRWSGTISDAGYTNFDIRWIAGSTPAIGAGTVIYSGVDWKLGSNIFERFTETDGQVNIPTAGTVTVWGEAAGFNYSTPGNALNCAGYADANRPLYLTVWDTGVKP